jgi:hypothetical protein
VTVSIFFFDFIIDLSVFSSFPSLLYSRLLYWFNRKTENILRKDTDRITTPSIRLSGNLFTYDFGLTMAEPQIVDFSLSRVSSLSVACPDLAFSPIQYVQDKL